MDRSVTTIVRRLPAPLPVVDTSMTLLVERNPPTGPLVLRSSLLPPRSLNESRANLADYSGASGSSP
jgi:hypothetical protein